MMIRYNEEAFCEHCGSLPPYTPTYDCNTSWCLDCAKLDDEFRRHWNERDIEYFKKKSYEKQINFHIDEIVRLRNLLGGKL